MSRRHSQTHEFPHYDASRKELPIYTYREELVEAMTRFQCLIVVGDTGSGKTTQLPQYVLEAIPEIRNICVTQPRRIAAISAARRVADERRTRLGEQVGYSIRFERSASSSTRLLYVTDGTLLRSVAADPKVSAYDLVVLDEAHERSLETDVLFGLLRRACRLRPELKVVVMSATLDIDKFSEFFGDAPVFSIPGRMYAVDILWQKKMKLGTAKATFVRRSVETVLHIHKNEEPGDVLVFLTGQQEIEQATRLLQEAHEVLDYVEVRHRSRVHDIAVYPIFSALETLEQRAIFEATPEGVRKIVVATNIAQTSVTIPGIRYVVDSGFVKQKMYDAQTGVDALVVVPISQAAATQRAGRAGRTASGKVYRLYSREAFEDMEPATVPEIQRSSLIGTVLSLKKMGIDDILNFEFIDPPDPDLVVAAIKQLFLLGAVDEHGHLTPLGHQMSDFPISPFLSRVLISAALDFSCSYEALIIASMLSVEEIFATPRGKKKQSAAEECRRRFDDPSGDHLTLLRIFHEWRDHEYSKNWTFSNFIHFRALQAARKVKEQLTEIMERLELPIVTCEVGDWERETKRLRRVEDPDNGRIRKAGICDFGNGRHVDSTPILRAFCTAFYVHTAKRHPQRPVFYPYVTSIGANVPTGQQTPGGSGMSSAHLMALYLHPQSALSSEDINRLDWVIYNDIQYVNRATMRVSSKIRFDWVDVLMGRLKVVDEERLAGRTPAAREGRRPSIISAVGEVDSKSDESEENDADGQRGKEPEFELVHEVIDEMHRVERAIGDEVGKSAVHVGRQHNGHGRDSSAGRRMSLGGGEGGLGDLHSEKVAEDADAEATRRESMVNAAKERYLKRKNRR
ncbi:hypothetical protein SpCBS45565_g06228 [Spizellomyces sp. 'palustris']|nr:hypothetical protein SpCBS45565_g06228 [Spizellomyces sp. 'palustris']